MADAKSVRSWRKIVETNAKFFVDSVAYVRVENDMSEWFPVNVGLRRGCVMSPWLFSTLTGCTVDAASIPIRAGHFRPDVIVYAISNFMLSFFTLKLFKIKCCTGIYNLNLECFNIMANNTRETRNLCKNVFFMKFIVVQANLC